MIRALFLTIFLSGLLSGGLPVRAAEDGVPETLGYKDIAAFFELSTDAHVNARDAKGQTAIYRTLDPLPKPVALRILLNTASPDISLQDDEGRDVLGFAESLTAKTEERYSQKLKLLNECLEELLTYRRRMSRLHQEWNFYAKCREGSLRDIRELVERGALINLPDEDGLTPLALALSGGHTEVANFIISKGGVLSENMRYEVSDPEEETRDELAVSRYEYKRDAEKYHKELLETRQKAADQQTDLQFYIRFTVVLVIVTVVLVVLFYKKPKELRPEVPVSPIGLNEALRRADKIAAIEAIKRGDPLMPNGRSVLNDFFQPGRETDVTILIALLEALMLHRKKEMTQEVLLKHLLTIIDRCESGKVIKEAVNFLLGHGVDSQSVHEGRTVGRILEESRYWEKGLTVNKAE